MPIIGSTYPDVILGSYVYPVHPAPPATISLAKVSVTAFKSLINPALSKSYASAKGSLVDVTAASGAYGPLTKTVKTKRYGRIPVPVDKVCKLTWFCSKGDIHSKNAGLRRDRQAHRVEVQRGQAEVGHDPPGDDGHCPKETLGERHAWDTGRGTRPGRDRCPQRLGPARPAAKPGT